MEMLCGVRYCAGYTVQPCVRQDQLGWRGPAEVLSVQRLTGTVIVNLQGQPLTVAISSVRRHMAADFYRLPLAIPRLPRPITRRFCLQPSLRTRKPCSPSWTSLKVRLLGLATA